MAAISWPSIRAPMSSTFTTERVSTFVDDSAKIGTPRRRKISTRSLVLWAFTQVCDAAETVTFETFIDTTTDGGVEIFDWTHPITAVVYEAMFDVLPRNIDGAPGFNLYEISLREV